MTQNNLTRFLAYPCKICSWGFFSNSCEKYDANWLPMKSDEAEADIADIDIAAAACGGAALAVAVAVPPLSNLIMVS